nr:MAG TPA: hypothetical protein [Caudoviricetes sp.]
MNIFLFHNFSPFSMDKVIHTPFIRYGQTIF